MPEPHDLFTPQGPDLPAGPSRLHGLLALATEADGPPAVSGPAARARARQRARGQSLLVSIAVLAVALGGAGLVARHGDDPSRAPGPSVLAGPAGANTSPDRSQPPAASVPPKQAQAVPADPDGATVCDSQLAGKQDACRTLDARAARRLASVVNDAEPVQAGQVVCRSLASAYVVRFRNQDAESDPIEVSRGCGPLVVDGRTYLLHPRLQEVVADAYASGR